MYLKAYENVVEAKAGIGAYLDFYNDDRPHQSLGYQTPYQMFEAAKVSEERRGADPQLVLV